MSPETLELVNVGFWTDGLPKTVLALQFVAQSRSQCLCIEPRKCESVTEIILCS